MLQLNTCCISGIVEKTNLVKEGFGIIKITQSKNNTKFTYEVLCLGRHVSAEYIDGFLVGSPIIIQDGFFYEKDNVAKIKITRREQITKVELSNGTVQVDQLLDQAENRKERER